MRIVLLMLALTTTVAHADGKPEKLRLGIGNFRGKLDGMTLVFAADERGGTRATWMLELSTWSTTATEVVIPLAVSRDIAVTALSMSQGDEAPLHGEALEPRVARQLYRDIVEGRADPALLEVVPSQGGDRLRLRVFPLTKQVPARVTVQLWIPGSHEIELDPGSRIVPRVEIHDDVRTGLWSRVAKPQTWTLTSLATGEPDDLRQVTRDRSLLARFSRPILNAFDRWARQNPRTLGRYFHERVAVTPGSLDCHTTFYPARQKAKLATVFDEPVAEEHARLAHDEEVLAVPVDDDLDRPRPDHRGRRVVTVGDARVADGEVDVDGDAVTIDDVCGQRPCGR
jgi:hypothetical protein